MEKSVDVYEINYNEPGRVFIFANYIFSNTKLPNLPLMLQDVSRIKNVFEDLHYEIISYLNRTSEEINDILMNISKSDFKNDSCVIIFIDSHGELDSIFGTDCNAIHTQKFFDTFKKIDSLKMKPKLFFADSCRGNGIMTKQFKSFFVDVESDIFIGYATVPGNISQIDKKGSIFIQELCSIIESDNLELDLIIRTINRNKADINMQVADVKHSLRKSFFFKTALFESKIKEKIYLMGQGL